MPIVAALATAVMLFYGALAYGTEDFAHESGQSLRQIIHFLLFLECVIGCLAVSLGNQLKLVSYYTLPIPTWKLIGWKLLYTVVATVLSYLALAITLNITFEAEWPLLGQALFVAVCVMWGQALTWSLHRSQLVAVIARMTAVMLLGGWVISRYITGPLPNLKVTSWDTVTMGECISLVAMAIAAYLYCLVGVSRDRYGSVPDFRSMGEAIEHFFSRRYAREQEFQSRQQALIWYQWRQKSFMIPATIVIVIVLLGWVPMIDMESAIIICAAMSVLGVVYCAGVAMIVGNSHDALKARIFYMSRPTTDTEMAHSVLRTTSWSIIIVWLIWYLGLAMVASRYILAGRAAELWQQIEETVLGGSAISWIWFYVFGLMLVSWCVAGLGVSLCLSRLSLQNSATYAALGGCLMWCVANFVLIPQEWRKLFLDATLGSLGMGFIIGTMIANGAALKHRLIRWQSTIGGAVACLVLFFVVYMLYSEMDHTAGMLIFAIGVCCLPAAPFATAPLAISWNRHR